MKDQLNRWFYFFLITGILINSTSLFNGILEPDGALYASIAKKMALNNDWINLIGNGGDWLDKPHLPFWLAALSFKYLGISSFAYKLPAFLCFVTGVLYLYRLAALVYNESTARLTVLIYITSLHVMLANFDVRAEGYLTCFVIAALYYLYRLQRSATVLTILPAALFTACAIMTKGIFVAVTIAGGFILHWIFCGKWNEFLKPRWWLVVFFSLVFILPELYCLYQQFDRHPEKIIFGQTHVSGLRFFFWDSQFGRFFNTGPIKGTGDKLFFVHTSLWAFLPWTLPLLGCLWYYGKKIKRLNLRSEKIIIAGSAVFTFLLFSFSGFQLPHYIVILLPHYALFTAAYLLKQEQTAGLRLLNSVQLILLILLSLLVIAIAYMYDRVSSLWAVLLFSAVLISLILLLTSTDNMGLLWMNYIFISGLFIYLNLVFYPDIMEYQAGMKAAQWLNKSGNSKKVIMYPAYSYSLEFYNDTPVILAKSLHEVDSIAATEPVLLFTEKAGARSMLKDRPGFKISGEFKYFHVSQLSFQFLNSKTRTQQLETFVLVDL